MSAPYAQKVLAPTNGDPVQLIYGSEELGFFETQTFSKTNGQVRTMLVPPSMNKTLIWAWKNKNSSSYHCEKKKLKSSLSSELKTGKSQILSGKFSTPFFLMNAHTGSKEEGLSWIYIVNRLGEIIWAHAPPAPPPSKDIRTRTLTVKQIRPGTFGILRPYENSYFEIVDFTGKTLNSLDPRHTHLSYPYHHDFIMQGKEAVLTLSHSLHHYRRWWKFWRKKDAFLGSPLLKFNLASFSGEFLWDYLEKQNPFQESDWKFTAEDSGSFWYGWDQPEVPNNFEHINSVQEIPGEGFLLSLRSLSKLLFLDKDFKRILWTMGPEGTNTYRTGGMEAEFYRQHHATQLTNGNILLFDNGRNTSRVLLLRPNARTHSVDLVRVYAPSPAISSPKHGSAFELSNGNTVGFFPNTAPKAKGPNLVIEFDGTEAREIARMAIDLGVNRVAYRAIPLTTIGNEHFLGMNNPTPCR